MKPVTRTRINQQLDKPDMLFKGEHVNVDPLSAVSETDTDNCRERCEDVTSLFRN